MTEETTSKAKKGFYRAAIILIAIVAASILYVRFSRSSHLQETDYHSLQTKANEAMTTAHADKESQDDREPLPNESEGDKEQEAAQEPLTDAPVKPSDIYAEKDSLITFSCFYPDAIKYTWETYIMESGWQKAEGAVLVSDELNRETSMLRIMAKEENDMLAIRCITEFKEKAPIVDTAALYILDKKIESISAKGATFDTGSYISAKDIPLTITYQDGSSEEITGLYSVYFLERSESSEQSTTVSGNTIETITTVITSHCYLKAKPGETDAILRYQGQEKNIDIPIRLNGEDTSAPIITQLSISDIAISNVDKPVPVTVSIEAEDNCTPYFNLEYAFLPEGEDPEEGDWTKDASFEAAITQNGKWIAYCRDESGNTGTSETDIIAVDNKPPSISLRLGNESWCASNKILVSAKDSLPVEYNYSCEETGEDSGWTSRNEYAVKKNSTWKVKVRDAAGNIAEQEITISNIDSQAPVITKITEKEGETTNNEDEEN